MFDQKPSPRQIQANRLNAQKSTGPRSVEGKAASSMNALHSGIHAESEIIRGEDAASLVELAAEYHTRWQPSTPEQRLLVDNLVHCEWLLRRLRRIDAEIIEYEVRCLEMRQARAGGPESSAASKFEYEVEIATDPQRPLTAGVAFDRAVNTHGNPVGRLQWRINSTHRLYHRSLEALQRLQSTPEPSRDPLFHPPQSNPVECQIGFVPQTSPDAPPPSPETPAPPASTQPAPFGFAGPNLLPAGARRAARPQSGAAASRPPAFDPPSGRNPGRSAGFFAQRTAQEGHLAQALSKF